MSNIFSETEVLKLPRSLQKFWWNLRSSMDYGKLYPMFVLDCVPGDTIRISGALNVRAKPMVFPNLTPNKLTMHFFFVPYRLLDDNFTKGVTGTTEKGEAYDYEFPKWKLSATSTKLKTLWDYLGLPINVKLNSSGVLVEDNTNVKGIEPTVYLKRAYNKIYNDMYRNENFIDEVNLDSENLQYRCWRADYFTKSLPWQQKPSEADYFALPVNSVASPTTTLGNLSMRTFDTNQQANWLAKGVGIFGKDLSNGNNKFTPIQFPTNGNIQILGGYKGDGSGGFSETAALMAGKGGSGDGTQIDINSTTVNEAVASDAWDPLNGHKGNSVLGIAGDEITKTFSITSTSFDMADLRLAAQMQKWAERNARGGTRYDEYIRCHFGIKPLDARLQLPEFLGGFKFPILCGENYSTVETTNNPQGTRAGIGNGVGADKIRKYFVEEYGVIMGIASILPQAEYQQGMPREWIKHNQLDFYHHELCCLSEREVYEGELVCSSSTTDATAEKFNKKTFGFQGIYNEYRYKPNIITGEPRAGQYASWGQSRILDSGYTTGDDGEIIPNTNLGKNFVECRSVRMSPFAAGGTEDPFLVTGTFTVKAFRPMTYKAEPGLIDHF